MLALIVTEGSAIRQVAALPYRIDAEGRASVLLITSRETRRWVLPKGNLIKGLEWHQAAAQEAFEEAGVTGIASPTAIGEYRYAKRRANGTTRDITVAVFPLAFELQAAEWPEQDERETRWYAPADAARAIEEPDLAALIAGFHAPPPRAELVPEATPAPAPARAGRPLVARLRRLLPRHGRVIDLLAAHAARLVVAGEALALLLRGGADLAGPIGDIRRSRREADEIARDVLTEARRPFGTALDRAGIATLIGAMQAVLDPIAATAGSVATDRIDDFPQAMRDMAAIIVEAARATAAAMPLLRSVTDDARRDLDRLVATLTELRGRADELYEVGLKTSFRQAGGDATAFFVEHGVFGALKRTADRFGDVAGALRKLGIER